MFSLQNEQLLTTAVNIKLTPLMIVYILNTIKTFLS